MNPIAETLRWITLSLAITLAAGCAVGDDDYRDDTATRDAGSVEDVLPDASQNFALLAELSRPRIGPISRRPDEFAAIDSLLSTITSTLTTDYFSTPISTYSYTPDGTAYRFYRGASGMGAIYMVDGGRYLYGDILTAWADQNYELGRLRYPRANPVSEGDSVEQEFAIVSYQPGVDDQCLADVRTFLVQPTPHSPVGVVERRDYYDSNNPGQLSPYPQQATWYLSTPLSPAARELAGGLTQQLWCGAVPAWLAASI
ncbi:MAG: hypothetical protein JWN04_5007 [Myxococcaceae bacterium]|nr:hypothetical protein [Myxococcaceae bacterium]